MERADAAGQTDGPGGTDLSGCATEPIHIPGAIQPHGLLLGLDAAGRDVRFASANVPGRLGLDDAPAGRGLAGVLGADNAERVRAAVGAGGRARPVRIAGPGDAAWDGIVRASPAGPLLEMEPAAAEAGDGVDDLYTRVRGALDRLQAARTLDDLHIAMAEEVRALTGMDRVMVYRFDDEWNGEVVAESAEPGMESYLGLRFPATDIPAQARELYRRNWVRLIADVDYEPARLEPPVDPLTREPIDLSACALRSVSPVHLQYLRNMGVRASMSVSLLRRDALWGLVACHHRTPRRVPWSVRTACEFLGQTFSVQLGTLVEEGGREYALDLARIEGRLLERLTASGDWVQALTHGSPALEAVVGATGAALRLHDRLVLSGATPEPPAVHALVEWLTDRGDALFATDHLARDYPDAASLTAVASGLLALSLRPGGRDWLLWFRPEVIRTVRWAGDPSKPAGSSADPGALTPRRSFAAYAETVRERARPWSAVEVSAAQTVRRRLVDIVLRQAEETKRLNDELRASNDELDAFAWIAGHDLKEPLRGIRTYARALQERDGGVGEELGRLIRLGDRMEHMLESLLEYARAGNLDLALQPVDLDALLEDVLETLRPRIRESGIAVRVPEPLPTVPCDPIRVSSVLQNLISNAIKYRSDEAPFVEVGWTAGNGNGPVFHVRDNGIGIAREHWDGIFDLFRRLHPASRYGGGAGAGLTIARRLVERHGGRLWLESRPGAGSTFYFTLGRTTT